MGMGKDGGSDWDKLGGGIAAPGKRKERKVPDLSEVDVLGKAGGVMGMSDVESWWKPGGVCTVAKRFIKAMTKLELVTLLGDEEVRRLVEQAMDPEHAKWAKRDAEEAPKILSEKGKSTKRHTPLAWWARTVHAIDKTLLGYKRLLGDFVKDVPEQCDLGEIVVIGLRIPCKAYAVCVATGSRERVPMFREYRPDIEMEGVRVLSEHVVFADVMAAVEAELERRAKM